MFSIFMKFNLSVFFLWLVLLRSCLQNHYLLKGHEDILLYFLLVLIVLVLAFPLGLQSIFFLKEHLFIYLFWLHWVFVAAHGLSLVATSGGYSPLLCAGFSLWWLLLLRSMGSRRAAFSSCGTRAQQLWLTGSRAQAQQLWHWAQLLRNMWDLPGPGIEPLSPVLAGGFLTTAPPEKSCNPFSELVV